MELVFFYINQTSSNFIQKKGFNFSANYNFYVDYIDEKYVLRQKKCTHKLPKDFFDEQGVITNITAVVGENGTGKTTLLNNISNYGGSVKNQDHDYEYDNYFMEKYEKDKTVAIYLEKCELVCYHNIDNFRNETGIKECYLQQGSVGLQDIVRNNKAFESISKICISNSMYALEDGVSIHRNINKISLNLDYSRQCRESGRKPHSYRILTEYYFSPIK